MPSSAVDKSVLLRPEPRRIRDREHVRFVSQQSCLVCGRRPCDAHHLRFVQNRALGRKFSDEFTVPLCRGHHREVHRHGDEACGGNSLGSIPPAPRVHYGLKLIRICSARKNWLPLPMILTPSAGGRLATRP
jgi:hypothetical protein